MALTGTAPSASAETDRYTPRIECGPEVPKGKRLHRGKNHIEIESKVKETHTSRFGGSPYFMVQRYALIKRSDCWVSFWAYSGEEDKAEYHERMTASFSEAAVYLEKIGRPSSPYRIPRALIGEFTVWDMLVLVDGEAAMCKNDLEQIRRSLPRPIKSDSDFAINHRANGEMSACMIRRARALDASGFFGIWDDMDEPKRAFAYVDGKLYTLNLSKGDVLP
ncbi:hypothetical protein [Gemmobacter denitrificans]|uniref:Uncharacterized protein n=1 Tax=Gemmobacter denitrificans TaxID=3123040 RepID=A0ABU8BXJ5_9RHOB